MNNWLHIRRFLLFAVIALLTAALGACSSENEPTLSDDGGDANGIEGRLALRISMGDLADSDVSRAGYSPADGAYGPGSGYENYIDLESAVPDYRVYVFDATDDRFLFSPDAAEVVRAENTDISCRDYELYFPLSEARCTQLRNCTNGFKIALLANWRVAYPVLTPGQSTVASIASSVEAVMEWMPRGAIATAADRIP
ncbi:MAG: hypothetical protein K2M97_03220, partial [Muribaculaceae bacterium]|nr:hypothetical protein [Muribaculaceae bacterium]